MDNWCLRIFLRLVCVSLLLQFWLLHCACTYVSTPQSADSSFPCSLLSPYFIERILRFSSQRVLNGPVP